MMLLIAGLYLLQSERALPLPARPGAAPVAAEVVKPLAPDVERPPRGPLAPSQPVAPAPGAVAAASDPQPTPTAAAAAPHGAAVAGAGGAAPAPAADVGLSAPPIGVAPGSCAFSGKVTLLGYETHKPVSSEGKVVVYVRVVSQDQWKQVVSPAVKVRQHKISQDDFEFSESLRVVVLGDAIDFVNEERDEHNVFSATKLGFEMPPSKNYSTGTYRFTKPGTAHVQCDIHPSMRMDVLVVTNPFFALADPTGHYTLKPLQPGTYEVIAWERNGGESKTRVTCPSAGSGSVDFTLQQAPTPPHRHKDGSDYREPVYTGR